MCGINTGFMIENHTMKHYHHFVVVFMRSLLPGETHYTAIMAEEHDTTCIWGPLLVIM